MRKGSDVTRFLLIGTALSLAACSGGKPEGNEAARQGAPKPAAPSPAEPVNAAAPAPGPQNLSSKTETFEFSYKWPAEDAAIPDLSAWIRSNGEKMRAQNEGEAKSDQAEAKKSGYPYIAHSYDEDFKTVADTPRILVLLSDGYVFTGGAHGMPFTTSILWDKAAKRRLATKAVIDVPRLTTVAKARFCAALDKEREKRRGEPVSQDKSGLDEFSKCVDFARDEILPIAKGTKAEALDTIRIVIGPYEAGPYAEGSYVIDLPVDAALLTAVKEPYREWFVAGK